MRYIIILTFLSTACAHPTISQSGGHINVEPPLKLDDLTWQLADICRRARVNILGRDSKTSCGAETRQVAVNADGSFTFPAASFSTFDSDATVYREARLHYKEGDRVESLLRLRAPQLRLLDSQGQWRVIASRRTVGLHADATQWRRLRETVKALGALGDAVHYRLTLTVYFEHQPEMPLWSHEMALESFPESAESLRTTLAIGAPIGPIDGNPVVIEAVFSFAEGHHLMKPLLVFRQRIDENWRPWDILDITVGAQGEMFFAWLDEAVGEYRQRLAQKKMHGINTRLVLAAEQDKIEAARQALAEGADPDFHEADGGSWLGPPLAAAAQNNNAALVKLLLKAGAQVHLKDMYSRTPLECAQNNRRIAERKGDKKALQQAIAIEKLLRQHGAD